MEPQPIVPGRKDLRSQPGPFGLYVVHRRVLEPQPPDDHADQRSRKELHLGRQGRSNPRQSKMGHVDAPDHPRGSRNHRSQDPI